MFRVIFFVPDPRKAAKFYIRAFGVKRLKPPKAQDYPDSEWIQTQSGKVEIAFHKTYEPKGLKKSRADESFKLVFKVKNVATKRKELLKLGVKMSEPFQADRTTLCDGWDCFGFRFQIADR